jgi:hypothetical protein
MRWLVPGLLLSLLLTPRASRAGLMRPVLELMRPQVEERLNRLCLETASGGRQAMRPQLEQPCRQLARTTSRCLVEETDASGKALAVMGELLRQQLGPEGERVAKRCLARLVGLPPGSLEALPLRQVSEVLINSRR